MDNVDLFIAIWLSSTWPSVINLPRCSNVSFWNWLDMFVLSSRLITLVWAAEISVTTQYWSSRRCRWSNDGTINMLINTSTSVIPTTKHITLDENTIHVHFVIIDVIKLTFIFAKLSYRWLCNCISSLNAGSPANVAVYCLATNLRGIAIFPLLGNRMSQCTWLI